MIQLGSTDSGRNAYRGNKLFGMQYLSYQLVKVLGVTEGGQSKTKKLHVGHGLALLYTSS